MNKNLPLIELTVDLDDENTGVYAISFVDSPATEVDWYAFDSKKPHKFDSDDTKQMITGPVMLANTPIYRYHPQMGEYNVIFRDETVMDMMKKYMSSDLKDNVNEQHDSSKVVKGVHLVESFILDDRMELNGVFKDLPKGTWMGTFYIEDKLYYNELVNNPEFNGFSLEGMFDEELINMSLVQREEKLSESLFNMIEEIVNDNNLSEEDMYNKIKKILH